MILYSIYNKQTERFNPPFVARDDDDAIETCRKAIIGGRDISLLVELENLELCSVCEFDSKSAICTGESAHVVFLAEIPLPHHLIDMITRMKEVKSV